MKKLVGLLLSMILILSIVPSSMAAQPKGTPKNILSAKDAGIKMVKLTDEDYKEMKNRLTNRGVSDKVADALVEKMKAGILPDSAVKELKAAKSVKTIKKGDKEETIYTFGDGSLIVKGAVGGIFTPASDVDSNTPMSTSKSSSKRGISTLGTGLTGGTYSSGSGYGSWYHRTVYYENVGVWKLSFQADWTYVNGGYDKISWAGNESTWLIYGTLGNPLCRILKSTESLSGKAEARYSAYLYIGGQYGTLTRSISLLVGGDTAVAQGNTYY